MQNHQNYQLLSWEDVRQEVRQVNPELAEIIDQINPDKRYPLVKASYRFGDLIVKDGTLNLPFSNQDLLPITSNAISKEIKDLLSYAPIPLSLLLNKSSEIFLGDDTRIIPLNCFKPGKIFGTFETIDSIYGLANHPIWNVAAGARTIFMLPKLSKSSGIKKLRTTFNIPATLKLTSLADHWQIFKYISIHHPDKNTWESHVIFFTKKWFEHNEDPKWFRFISYLFKQGWQQSQFSIAKFEFGIFWQKFIRAISNRNLKPSTYLSDTVKHLLAVATGAAPAFIPTIDTELVAPTKTLQNAIVNIYQLDNYAPSLLHADLLNETTQSVYYSLNFPTILEGTPEGKKSLTIMLDLKEIKLMMETLLREIKTDHNNLIKNVDFKYYHADDDKHREIISSKLMPTHDLRFIQEAQFFNNREFCWTSAFWQGCIKIEKNSNVSKQLANNFLAHVD